MITIEFNEADIEALDYERFNHPHPKVRRKMEALYLKAKELKHGEICRLCGISKQTLVNYLKQYLDGGLERLGQLDYKGEASKLNAYREQMIAYFTKRPPTTIAEAQYAIEQQTGLKRSPTQIREFLLRIGMKCRKVGHVPGKIVEPAKITEQETFQREELEPRLEEARADTRKVYFVDAAHFVFRVYLGFLWCFQRLFIPSPSGRKRFNVLGALDAVTHEVLTITNFTSINSRSVCKLLDKIAEANRGLDSAITVFLDNVSRAGGYESVPQPLSSSKNPGKKIRLSESRKGVLGLLNVNLTFTGTHNANNIRAYECDRKRLETAGGFLSGGVQMRACTPGTGSVRRLAR